MFHASMRCASTSATAHARACSRMRGASSARRSAVSFFESSMPAMRIQPNLRAAHSKREEQSRLICFGATLMQHRGRLREILARYLTNERRETKASFRFIHSEGRPWGRRAWPFALESRPQIMPPPAKQTESNREETGRERALRTVKTPVGASTARHPEARPPRRQRSSVLRSKAPFSESTVGLRPAPCERRSHASVALLESQQHRRSQSP